ncbi:hypothetical protein GGR96_000132 [Thalassospira tepidiphila]|uniref:Uncharacterized protein n=2 Tax=Thalassospira tepidiphila TaxID=393657 RepID=A0A853L499_9PROT|nr:hypothetical protein [Thalassospira tepidiphila]OAZ11214.1 hypothetical protein TH4_06705 [Thalassospira tepidiphila MCCC 1A03514]
MTLPQTRGQSHVSYEGQKQICPLFWSPTPVDVVLVTCDNLELWREVVTFLIAYGRISLQDLIAIKCLTLPEKEYSHDRSD